MPLDLVFSQLRPKFSPDSPTSLSHGDLGRRHTGREETRQIGGGVDSWRWTGAEEAAVVGEHRMGQGLRRCIGETGGRMGTIGGEEKGLLRRYA
jgi:hypothetical protein